MTTDQPRDHRAGTAMPMTPLLTALGFSFTVEANEPVLVEHLAHVLGGLSGGRSDGEVRRYRFDRTDGEPMRLFGDGVLLRESLEAPVPFEHLFWEVNREAVASAARAGDAVVHGAAVEMGGSAVLLSAPMDAGKSTLCTGLVRAGARYLTDEAAAVDARRLVVRPYAKPITLDPGSWPVLSELQPAVHEDLESRTRRQWHVPAPDIPGAGYAEECAIGLVVLPRYDRTSSPASVEPLTRAQALVELCQQSFTWSTAPEHTMAVLAEVLRGAKAVRLQHSNLDAAVEAVQNAVEGVR